MAVDPYQELFAKYIEDLEWAVNEANALRAEDFANLHERFEGDRARAQEAFQAFGPLCADPYVIGAVREYWLACDRLNRTIPTSAVEPRVFVLDWLRSARPDLASVINEFPYWPIGQDAEGRWV